MGTCHLVKEIKKEKPEKKKSPFTASDNSRIELLYFESSITTQVNSNSKKASDIAYISNDFDAHLKNVFHPPKSSVHC